MAHSFSITREIDVVWRNRHGALSAMRVVPENIWYGKEEFYHGPDQWYMKVVATGSDQPLQIPLVSVLSWSIPES